MSHENQDPRKKSQEDARAARRRFLKAAATGAVAVPVIETVTGRDLLTVSAQAQTGLQGFMSGAFTGDLDQADTLAFDVSNVVRPSWRPR